MSLKSINPATGKRGHFTADLTLDEGRIENVREAEMLVFESAKAGTHAAAVVICPGGGYALLSVQNEGVDIARWYNSLGIHAYVLLYRMKEFGYPAPLQDVAGAVRYLRGNAEQLGLDPQRIGVMGFSAGGHVAAMASTLFAELDAAAKDGQDAVSARPDFAVLAYPVITLDGPHAHAGSRVNLLGPEADAEIARRFSLELRVSKSTPPTFLMHTANDAAVPVENSLQYASALAAHAVPFALHVYPDGPHGIGMLHQQGSVTKWPIALAEWLQEQGLARTSGELTE